MHVPAPHTRLVVVTATAPPRVQNIPVVVQVPRVTVVAPHAIPSVLRVHATLSVWATHVPASQRNEVDSLVPLVAQASA